MKFEVCFLAVVSCALALPAEVPFEGPEELDLSQLIPNNIYLKPVNPVKTEDLPGSRIIGGTEVSPNSVPYQVALLINGLSFCGGSLISSTRVLTAAHCTIRAAIVQVRLGAHRFNINEATQVRLTSTSVRNHANYNEGGFAANDIAVVFLPSTVVTNSNIQVIPLAPVNAGSFAGSRAFLSGWGRTSDASSGVSPVLNAVNLDIIDNIICRFSFGDNILPTTICTSGAGIVGGCHGDSGGPLVVNGIQVGVVSFGSPECELGSPTAYARITAFRQWIKDIADV